MRVLHTSDWHVGKQIRGRSRQDEHRAVFAEIIDAASSNNVDLALVAGDLFETAAPTGEHEKLVYETLLALAEISPVAVISGNHDNSRRLRAIAPVMSHARIHLVTEPVGPKDGGVVEFKTEAGEVAKVAMLPFVSQRSIVKSEHLLSNQAFQNSQGYAQRLSQVVDALSQSFDDSSVNIFMTHAFVTGGETGGGERPAHIVDEYGVPALAFPVTASYVALGHLHRAQAIPGATAIHYCGSPLQMDFGETDQTKQANLVELAPGLPAKVEPIYLEGGRKLVKVSSTAANAVEAAREFSDDSWVRLDLEDSLAPGEADAIRTEVGDSLVEIRAQRAEVSVIQAGRKLDGASPKDLFSDYLTEKAPADQILLDRFVDLHEEVLADAQAQAAKSVTATEGLET